MNMILNHQSTDRLTIHNCADLFILVPGDVLGGEDEPVIPAAPLHDPQVVDCHVALPDHLQPRHVNRHWAGQQAVPTWFPSFRPVFSAFWVVVCALKFQHITRSSC